MIVCNIVPKNYDKILYVIFKNIFFSLLERRPSPWGSVGRSGALWGGAGPLLPGDVAGVASSRLSSREAGVRVTCSEGRVSPRPRSVHVGTWAPDQQTKPARNDSFPAAQAWRPTGDPVTEQRGAPPGLAGRPGSHRDLRAGVGSDAGHPQRTEVRRRPLSSQATAQAAPSRPSAPGPPPPAPEGVSSSSAGRVAHP